MLEDYHLITNPAVYGLTNLLIDGTAADARHALCSSDRSAAGAGAATRARPTGGVACADLRFTAQEVRARPSGSVGAYTPVDASIAALCAKTEGWAAAIQIVASSLADADAHSAHRFIDRLSGVQRHIFAYLAEEVFRRRSPQQARIFIQTAVLVQIDGDLQRTVGRSAMRKRSSNSWKRRISLSSAWTTSARGIATIISSASSCWHASPVNGPNSG